MSNTALYPQQCIRIADWELPRVPDDLADYLSHPVEVPHAPTGGSGLIWTWIEPRHGVQIWLLGWEQDLVEDPSWREGLGWDWYALVKDEEIVLCTLYRCYYAWRYRPAGNLRRRLESEAPEHIRRAIDQLKSGNIPEGRSL